MNAILDTNALIDGIDLEQFDKVWVSVPVVEELDNLKLNKNIELARSAKKAIRTIRNAKNVEIRFNCACSIPLNTTLADNLIIAYAKEIQAIDTDAVFISADNAAILKATHLGLKCEYFDKDALCSAGSEYHGYKEVKMSDYELAVFYECKTNKWSLKDNEYLIIYNSDGDVVDKMRWTSSKGFVPLFKKAFDSMAIGKFKAKDVYQECAMDSIMNTEMSILVGAAGTAKTLVSLAYIMQELQNGNRGRCVIIFSTMELRNNKAIGFLPGTSNEKLLGSTLGGILSAKLGDMLVVNQLIAQGKLLLIPSCSIRGFETMDGDCLFVTEAQNMDVYTLKTVLQRAKDGTKVIIEGDIDEQVDSDYCAGRFNGMMRAIETFAGKKVFSTVRLKNIYRGEIANIAQNM